MIRIYAACADMFKDKDKFDAAFFSLSQYRRNKILALKNDSSKRLSLAAGYLISKGLERLGVEERTAEYAENENGKPYLKNHGDIFFNASHSAGLAVCVFSDSSCGIDAESLSREPNIKGLSARFFSEREKWYISEAENTRRAFFEIWTKKESLLKAAGIGITRRLNDICTMEDRVILDGDRYYFASEETDGYMISVCSNKALPPFNMDFFEAI